MSDKKSEHIESSKDNLSNPISYEGTLCQHIQNKLTIRDSIPAVVLRENVNTEDARKSSNYEDIFGNKIKLESNCTVFKNNGGNISVEKQSVQHLAKLNSKERSIEKAGMEQYLSTVSKQMTPINFISKSYNQTDEFIVADIKNQRFSASISEISRNTNEIDRIQSTQVKKCQTDGEVRMQKSKSIKNIVKYNNEDLMQIKHSKMIPITSKAVDNENQNSSCIAKRVKKRGRALRINNSSKFFTTRIKKRKQKPGKGKEGNASSNSYCHCESPERETCLLCVCHDCKVSEILKCIDAKGSDEISYQSKKNCDRKSNDIVSFCTCDNNESDTDEENIKRKDDEEELTDSFSIYCACQSTETFRAKQTLAHHKGRKRKNAMPKCYTKKPRNQNRRLCRSSTSS